MDIVFTQAAEKDYAWWKSKDSKKAERIHKLCESIQKDPYDGIGKPEPLKYTLQGYWSRRIDREHRLVYTIEKDRIIIISCRFHY